MSGERRQSQVTGPERFGDVSVRVDAAVGTIVLDAPERRNSLDGAMLQGLIDAASWLNLQGGLKVVTVRGAGDQFTAGADIGLLASLHAGSATIESADLGRKMADAVAGIDAVTIACVAGYAVGGGVVLAAACDLRLFAADAWISIPEIDIGIPLAWGGIPRLVRMVGIGPATDLILTGRRVSAAEAHRLGFANRVTEPERFEAAIEELVETLVRKPRSPLLADVRTLRDVTEGVAEAGGRVSDAELMLSVLGDPEAVEAGKRYLSRFGV